MECDGSSECKAETHIEGCYAAVLARMDAVMPLTKADDLTVAARKFEVRRKLDEAQAVVGLLPAGREAALVRTKIDEALLWLGEIDELEPS